MSTLALHLNKPYGFTCQPWLATDVANRYFNRVYRTWFATTLNPRHNGLSSNPLSLYHELDDIVHTNDFNHSRIFQLRQRLTNWIAGSALAAVHIASLRTEISSAPVTAFRPQLWRINLSNIHIARLINLGQYPDEYQIRDLIEQEFQIIA